jgi:catechol 2,3-dioxygenase-like lactoylglutathione lyase family enzyme
MSTTQLSEIATVIIPVADQDKALEFYVGVLGFEKRSDTPFGDGNRWVEVAPAGSATVIAIVPPQPGQTEVRRDSSAISLTSEDIDADHAYLSTKGLEMDPQVMRMGDPVPPMFHFSDPDGNNFWVIGRT